MKVQIIFRQDRTEEVDGTPIPRPTDEEVFQALRDRLCRDGLLVETTGETGEEEPREVRLDVFQVEVLSF